uniref:Uncharacterized protein n=1 Tax=Setaria digitata TaxID=48799 RepID=A0A915Q861_9BILA
MHVCNSEYRLKTAGRRTDHDFSLYPKQNALDHTLLDCHSAERVNIDWNEKPKHGSNCFVCWLNRHLEHCVLMLCEDRSRNYRINGGRLWWIWDIRMISFTGY